MFTPNRAERSMRRASSVVVSIAQSPMFRGRSAAHISKKVRRSWRKKLANCRLTIEMGNLNVTSPPGNTGLLIQHVIRPRETEGFCIHFIDNVNGVRTPCGRGQVYHLTQDDRQDAHLLADVWLVNFLRGYDLHRVLAMLRVMVLWCQGVHPADIFLATPEFLIADAKTWGFVDAPNVKLAAAPMALQKRAEQSEGPALPAGILHFSNDRIWSLLRTIDQLCKANVIPLEEGLSPIELGPMLASYVDLMRVLLKEVEHGDNIVA